VPVLGHWYSHGIDDQGSGSSESIAPFSISPYLLKRITRPLQVHDTCYFYRVPVKGVVSM
jgi:hypothetical protein